MRLVFRQYIHTDFHQFTAFFMNEYIHSLKQGFIGCSQHLNILIKTNQKHRIDFLWTIIWAIIRRSFLVLTSQPIEIMRIVEIAGIFHNDTRSPIKRGMTIHTP